jgi:hypothetical protein
MCLASPVGDYRFAVMNPDAKHGRWILPLIIASMVVLTFTFVNSLEPASNVEGPTTQPEPPFPTEPTSPTTSLPPDLQAFIVTLDIFQNQATAFGDQLDTVNAAWEDDEASFGDTREAFLDLNDEISQWENEVAQVEGVPPEVAELHVALVVEVGDLAPKVEDVVLGLEAPDDGTLRRTAVAEFSTEIQQVIEALEAIKTALAGGTTPTTSGDTTTSTVPETTGADG